MALRMIFFQKKCSRLYCFLIILTHFLFVSETIFGIKNPDRLTPLPVGPHHFFYFDYPVYVPSSARVLDAGSFNVEFDYFHANFQAKVSIMVSISGAVENQPASTLSSSTVGIISRGGLKALTGTASRRDIRSSRMVKR